MLKTIKKLIRKFLIRSRHKPIYTGFHSKTMPKIRPIIPAIKNHKTFIDFTGTVKGNMIVLGLAEAKGHWIVRCSCGVYETRKAAALKSILNIKDCCNACRKVAIAENRAHFIETGEMLGIDFFLDRKQEDIV